MNNNKLYEIIKTLNATGINTAILEDDSSKLLIRGADEDGVVFVYHTLDDNEITESSMGLDSISILMNKMSLIDLSKSKVVLDDDGDCVTRITFKEGRKKVTHTLSNPAKLQVPSSINYDDIKSCINLSSSDVNDIVKALNTYNPKEITLEGIGEETMLKFTDKDSDIFENVIGKNTNGDWKHSWKKDKFVKLLKTTLAENDNNSMQLVISERGILYFEINDIIIMQFPTE